MSKSKGLSSTYAFIVVAAAVFITAALIVSFSIGGEGAPQPPVTNVTTTPSEFQPISFRSYQDLLKFLKARAAEAGADVFEAVRGGLVVTPTVTPLAATVETAKSPVGGAGVYSWSQTNVQVAGVDEADVVKVYPPYIFVVSGNTTYIVKAYPGEDMKVLSKVSVRNPIRGIYVTGDRLVVIEGAPMIVFLPELVVEPVPVKEENETTVTVTTTERRTEPSILPYRWMNTTLHIYDISDPASPKEEGSIEVSGEYVTSRYLDGYVYLIVQTPIMIKDEKLFVPMVDGEEASPEKIKYLEETTPRSYTIILAVEVDTGEYNYDVYLLGWSSYVYVSTRNMYILSTYRGLTVEKRLEIIGKIVDALPEDVKERVLEVNRTVEDMWKKERIIERIIMEWFYSQDEETQKKFLVALYDIMKDTIIEYTRIYKFKLDKLNVAPVAKGEVPGYLLDQFSMDEYQGYFRVATTSSRMGFRIGGFPELLALERVNNVYVLDENLNLIGKLEGLAPGESIYAARYMGDLMYLVTFRRVDPLYGIDLSDPKNPKVLGFLKIPGYSEYLHPYGDYLIGIGLDADEAGRVKGLKISLFDISDPANIVETSTITMEGRVYSPIFHDHKAFTINYNMSYFAIPISEGPRGEQGILVVKISDGKLVEVGLIRHEGAWRSAYMNDVIYAVGHYSIKAVEYPDLNIIGEVKLG